jgi:Zn-dependent peptidase ImmA (M78 family)/transcriptional regulator with XRE-family HTH domain
MSVNPEAVLVARESRGRTQLEVAQAIGVTQGLISKAEQGTTTLKDEDVVAMGNYLHYPPSFFYESGRIRDTGSACLYHRKRKTLPAKVLKQLDARMMVRNVNVRHLLNGLEISGDRDFYTLDLDEFGGSPVEVARALRAAWRVPEGPIQNLTALIESAGGIVIAEDFGTRKLFGMSCWTTHGRPLFFLNSAMPTEELRWTVAHELGHLTMHAFAPEGDQEAQADAFAGEFLAPERVFRPQVSRLDFTKLAPLKTFWRISMKAVITRAQKIGAIDPMTATKLYKQYSARRYNSGEPYKLSPEPSTLLTEAVRIHLQEHGYTREELAQAARLQADEFYRDFLGERVPTGNVVNLFPNPAISNA